MKIDFSRGGAKVIDRIIDAYGFKTKLQLCNHLGVSSANLSMRYKRDFFPSDLVVRCMADTGVSLEWLVRGEGERSSVTVTDYKTVKADELVNGKLTPLPNMILDKALLPDTDGTPEVVKADNRIYIVARDDEEIFSGKYLIEIEGRTGVYDVQRYPVNMLKISGESLMDSIDCKLTDVNVLAKVVTVIDNV